MTISVPDPRDVPIDQWVGEMCLQDPNVPFIRPDQDWRRWAVSLQDATTITKDFPNPYQFTDWRQWAVALKNIVG